MQDKITAFERRCLIDDPEIGRTFYDANESIISCCVGTDFTKRMFGKGAALLTMTDVIDGVQQRFGQRFGAVAVALEQVECHALRRFRANTGQATLVLYQLS